MTSWSNFGSLASPGKVLVDNSFHCSHALLALPDWQYYFYLFLLKQIIAALLRNGSILKDVIFLGIMKYQKYLLCEEVESPVVNIWSSVMLSELQSCRTWVISLTSFACVFWSLLFWQLIIFYIVCIPLEGVLKHRCKLLPGKKNKKKNKTEQIILHVLITVYDQLMCLTNILKKKHTYSIYNTAVNTTWLDFL